MIRHLLRIVWNRRRTNLLISFEIFLSFLVLATVITLGVFLFDNYRQPLGFTYQNVWSVRIAMNTVDMELTPADQLPFEQTPAGQRVRVTTLLRLVRDLPGVESAATAANVPTAAVRTSAIAVAAAPTIGAEQANARLPTPCSCA
jgi:putative ABC transport system permease protein